MWPVVVALFFFQQPPDHVGDGIKALEGGKYEQAVQLFRKAAEADPKDYTAHFHLGLAYSMMDRDAEGIAAYRKTLELRPGLYEAELNAGILLMRSKEPADALPLLEHAAEQKPAEFQPRFYAAEAQLQTGAFDKAEESYKRAIGLDAKSAVAELGLAQALARQNKLEAAAPHFRRSADLEPKFRDHLLELGSLYEQNRQVAEATAIYREFPENAAAQQRLGRLMMENRQYADALPRLEAAFASEATPGNRAALAAAYVFTGQLDKAMPLLENTVAAEPANFEMRMMYARALRDRKQFTPAAAQFLEAAKLKPGDAVVFKELGGMLYLSGSLPQALAAFDRARELGDNSAGNSFLRAIILDKLKQLKPALEAYRQFLAASQGKSPDQEFQARQRSRIIQRELEKR